MSVNKNLPHVLVLPEDDANTRLANAFHLEVDVTRLRRMQVLPAAGGWNEVLNRFKSDHVTDMIRYRNRFMVLLIDFDSNEERLNIAQAAIPRNLSERVFVLGALSNPEGLKKVSLGSYETIGFALARDCREDSDTTWGHDLLRHNASELHRLRMHVRPFLFQSV